MIEYGHGHIYLKAALNWANSVNPQDWSVIEESGTLAQFKLDTLSSIVEEVARTLEVRALDYSIDSGDMYDYNPFDQKNGWRE